MAKVELKQPIVAEIAESVKDAKAAVLVQYLGLSVEDDTKLRKELREAGVIYKVYKNTMMHRAFEGTEMEVLDQHLEGPNALAISKEDAVMPAKLLAKYVNQFKFFNFVGGVVEGEYYDEAQLTELSKVPSKDELLGKLLGSIQSPIANFARVLKQIAENGGEAAVKEEDAAAEAPAEAEAEAEAPAEEVPAEEAAPAEAEAEAPAEEAPAEEAAPAEAEAAPAEEAPAEEAAPAEAEAEAPAEEASEATDENEAPATAEE